MNIPTHTRGEIRADEAGQVAAQRGPAAGFGRLRAESMGGWAGVAAFVALSFLPFVVLALAWLGEIPRHGMGALLWAVPSQRGLLLLSNSLLLAAAVALVATFLGSAMALWMYEGRGRWHRLVRYLYLLPLLIPPYLHALAWVSIAGRRQALDQAIAWIVGPNRVSVSAYGFWPAVLVAGLALAPIVAMLVLRGLESIEPELIEQASLLRSPWLVSRLLLLPLVAPALAAGAGLVFVLTMVEYGVPSLFQFNVYVMETYASFSQNMDPVRALASSAPLMALAVAVLLACHSALRNNTLRGAPDRPYHIDSQAWPMPARLIVKIGVGLAIIATTGSVLILLIRSNSPTTFAVAVPSAWDETGRTLAVAALSATVSAMVAVPAALALARPGWRQSLIWLLCALPLAVPAPLTGIALIYLSNSPWLDWSQSTLLPLVWAHTARLLPFAIYAAATQIRRIDPLLFEAASLHRVGFPRALLQVRLPLMAPAISLAWLVVFVLSLGELGASLLIAPPGQATLPIRIYNLMHYGSTETVAALSLVIMVSAAVAGAAAVVLGRRLWPWTM